MKLSRFPDCVFGYTPFGVYCFHCSQPLGKPRTVTTDGTVLAKENTLTSHIRRSNINGHSHPGLTYSGATISKELNVSIMMCVHEFEKFIMPQGSHNNNYMTTICDRQISFEVLGFWKLHFNIKPFNKYCFSVTDGVVKEFLKSFKRIDEETDVYIPYLRSWLVELMGDETTLRSILEIYVDASCMVKSKGVEVEVEEDLVLILKVADLWYNNLSTWLVRILRGDIRKIIQVFNGQLVGDDTNMQQCFNPRHGVESNLKYLQKMICFYWSTIDKQ